VTRSMNQRKTDSRAEGQAGAWSEASHNNLCADTNDHRPNPMNNLHKANGHALQSTIEQDVSRFEDWAASDDVRGHLAAETAPSAAGCANRDDIQRAHPHWDSAPEENTRTIRRSNQHRVIDRTHNR
jgi:hypothetical protein